MQEGEQGGGGGDVRGKRWYPCPRHALQREVDIHPGATFPSVPANAPAGEVQRSHRLQIVASLC